MRALMVMLLGLCAALTGSSQTDTLILQPGPTDGCDTYINSAHPNEPGWDKGFLITAWTLDGIPFVGKSLISFDLSALSSSDSIIEARFSLYFDPQGSWPEHSGENAAFIRRITEHWSPSTATWNNPPSTTDAGSLYLPPSVLPHQDYTDIEVTEFVRGWVSGTNDNYGMMVSLITETPYACLVFAPSERNIPEKRPRLEIIYRRCEDPVAGFMWEADSNTVWFTDTSSSATTWFWVFGDGYSSSLQHPVHTYAHQGIYTVCLDISDSCGTDRVCEEIRMCVDPDPVFTYQSDGLTVIFRDSSVMPHSWWWDFGDGFYSELQHPVHYFRSSGTYWVCETVSNSCSTMTCCDSVTVTALAVSTNVAAADELVIYPNPAGDRVFIEAGSSRQDGGMVSLWTLYGECLKKIPLPGHPGRERNAAGWESFVVELSLESLSPGVYLVTGEWSDRRVCRKLVVR